jgi:hypothetical protein
MAFWLLDTSGLTAPTQTTVAVDVYLSYRQKTTFNVAVFAPCYSTNLPAVGR